MQFSKQEIEIIYASGYRFYQQGAYEKAAELFTTLVMYDPFDQRSWKGLAAARQMDQKYQAAVQAWGVLALLSGHAPDAHFHAAECLLSWGEREEALKALQYAEQTLNSNTDLSAKLQTLKEVLSHAS